MAEQEFNLRAGSAEAGKRLDIVLTDAVRHAGLECAPTRSQVGRWIAEGRVTIDGTAAMRGGIKLKAGMLVQAQIPERGPGRLEPDPSVPFYVVYEDEDLLIINKPAGVVVHPGAGVRGGTLVQGLVAYLGERLQPIGDALRPGIVHRLDKDTSGLMVVAKNETSYRGLIRQFAPPRRMSRVYLALTARLPQGTINLGAEPPQGRIDLAIGRDERTRVKMAAVGAGKGRAACTHWTEKRRFPFGHLLELRLETGRTHQIRVHLSAAKSPILGDKLYGPEERSYPAQLKPALRELGRQALHAAELSFDHPRTNERITFTAELPADMLRLISALEGLRPGV